MAQLPHQQLVLQTGQPGRVLSTRAALCSSQLPLQLLQGTLHLDTLKELDLHSKCR